MAFLNIILRTPKDTLFSGVVLVNSGPFSLCLGLFTGTGLSLYTLWMLLTAQADNGFTHLLSHLLLGYGLSLGGSLAGLAYGFALGSLAGALMAGIYNAVVRFRNRPNAK